MKLLLIYHLKNLKYIITYLYNYIIGETYVRVLIILREDKKRVISKDEIFKRSIRIKR